MRKILFVLTLFCLFGVNQLSGMERKIETFKQSLTTLKQKLVALSVSLQDVKQKLAAPAPAPQPNIDDPEPIPDEPVVVETEEEKIAREAQEELDRKERQEAKEKAIKEKVERERDKTCTRCQNKKKYTEFPILECGCNAPEIGKTDYYCKEEYNKFGSPIHQALTYNDWNLFKCVGCGKLMKEADIENIVTDGIIGGRYENIPIEGGEDAVILVDEQTQTKNQRIAALKALKPEMKECGACYEEKLKVEFPLLKCGCDNICRECYNKGENTPIYKALTEKDLTVLKCFALHKVIAGKPVEGVGIGGKLGENAPFTDEDLDIVVTDGEDVGKIKLNKQIKDYLDPAQMQKQERINRIKLLRKKKDPLFRECPHCADYYILGEGKPDRLGWGRVIMNFHETSAKNEYTCPTCKKSYCPDCLKKWHPGVICEELNLAPEEKKAKDLQKQKQYEANFLYVQRCPNCGLEVSREPGNGCLYLRCTCRTEFCFGCQSKTHHVWACRNGYIYSSKKEDPNDLNSPTTFTIRFGKEVWLDFTDIGTKWDGFPKKVPAPTPGTNAGEYYYEFQKKLKEELNKIDSNLKIEFEIKKIGCGKFEDQTMEEKRQKKKLIEIEFPVPEIRVTTPIPNDQVKNILEKISNDFSGKGFEDGIHNLPKYDPTQPQWKWYNLYYEPDQLDWQKARRKPLY